MNIETSTAANGVTVIRPQGRLDMRVAPDIRQGLAELARTGNARMVLDLEAVSFIDSSGLGAIISGLKSAREAGGDLRIARPNQQVRLVLQLTTLDRVLKPHSSVEEAMDGL